MSNFDRILGKLNDGTATQADMEQLQRVYPAKVAEAHRRLGHKPVRVNGSAVLGARAGYYQAPLRDGTVGYYMRRTDDCLQAAIASCLQIPPHLVPDLHIDDQVRAGKDPEEIERATSATLNRWTERRGLTIMIHPQPPTSDRRWIGVVRTNGMFNDHCLLMCKRERLFNPLGIPTPQGLEDPYNLVEIDYGITLRKE
jgi:hypothetical protein